MAKIVGGLVRVASVIAALFVMTVIAVWGLSELRVRRTWTITQAALAIDRSEAAIENGRHFVATRGCTECHGADLGGAVVMDDPAMGFIYAPNITRGSGSVVDDYTEADWTRTIRHGVTPLGRSLLIMPTEDYYFIDDRDLGNMITYLESVPSVDRTSRPSKIGPLARALLIVGAFPALSAERVNHGIEVPNAPPPAATSEYGHYVSRVCIGCHGEDLRGGKIAAGSPDWPAAANLTPHERDGIGEWTEADFFRAIREGKRPDGRELDPAMPRIFANLSDEEIRALWLYIRSVPARPSDPA